MEKQKTCLERVEVYYASTMGEIEKLWKTYQEDPEKYDDVLETNLNEYGLAFDYVKADTFTDQENGYYRWQLSWGGPSDEFRFYVDIEYNLYKLEYWFLDWGDGAHRNPVGSDYALLKEIFECFFYIEGRD